MVNEKVREGVAPWTVFHSNEKMFNVFWERVLSLRAKALNLIERSFYVDFLINAFHSLEDPLVRPLCLRLVSLPCWHALSSPKRAQLLSVPRLSKMWKHMQKLESKGGAGAPTDRDRFFMSELVQDYLNVLRGITAENVGMRAFV